MDNAGSWLATTYEEMRTNMDIFDKIRGWRAYRRTVNELNSLSNRELTDLGISRSDIQRVARNGR